MWDNQCKDNRTRVKIKCWICVQIFSFLILDMTIFFLHSKLKMYISLFIQLQWPTVANHWSTAFIDYSRNNLVRKRSEKEVNLWFIPLDFSMFSTKTD